MGRVYFFFLLLLLVCFLSGCANGFFYRPSSVVYQTPKKDGYVYENVSFLSYDQTALHGWFIPAVGEAKGTVIHFHGNAQNLSAHYSFVSWLPRVGYNLILFDNR